MLKNWVGGGLGQVRTKHLLAQTISNKVFGIKRSNPVKVDRKGKVWYLLLRVFKFLSRSATRLTCGESDLY